jgi:Na+/H+-dicarboxylate symporter
MAQAPDRSRRPWYRQLHWLILLGMVTGLSLGLLFTALGQTKPFAEVMSWPGTLFINLLKMIVVPLVFTSIVLGVASLGEDLSRLGRIGAKTFGYYMATTALAVTVGLLLVNVVRPGDRGQEPKVGVETLVQRHDLVVVPPTEARLALVQGALDVPALSVAIAQGPTLFEATGFGVQTLPVPLAPGRYSLSLSAEGKHLLDVEDVVLEPGAVTRLVVTGRADEKTLAAKLLVDPVADPAWVTVRVVHGAPSLPALDVEPEGGEAVSLRHEDGAQVLRVLPGRAVTVRLGSGSRAAVTSLPADDLAPGQAYSLYVFGRRPTAEPIPLGDVILGIVPSNLLRAFVDGDVLPIIFFGLFFGIALSLVGAKGRPVIAFIDGTFAAVMKMTDVIMWTAPIGVAALLGKVVAEMGPDALVSLMWYMATVLAGLAIHGVVVLPVLLAVLGRHNPLVFARQVSEALVTSFSTASSSATLPVSMEAVEKKAGVSNRIASFVLPLGATVNMDGTALYEAVAAMFIAQIYGIDISFGQQVVIFLTATLAAIGAAGVPSAGLVTMLLVLRAVGLPDEGVALIVGVDRLLDMVRTSVNVWGDCVGAYIVARSEGELETPAA